MFNPPSVVYKTLVFLLLLVCWTSNMPSRSNIRLQHSIKCWLSMEGSAWLQSAVSAVTALEQ